MASTRTSGQPAPACLICGGGAIRRSLFGGYRYLGTEYYRFQCERCGFIFVSPTPASSVFEAMYGDTYFDNYYGGGDQIGYEKSGESGLAQAEKVLRHIGRHVASGRLLDIGCAGGHFLAAARQHGYTCVGVELSPRMAEYARAAYGLNVLNCPFEDLPVEGEGAQFDVIYMGDSLEHLPDPRGTLARVRQLLAPGGVFVLHGPLTLNWSLFTSVLRLKLLIGRGRSEWYVEEPPYHLWEWNAKTMRDFLGRCGFRILDFVTWEEPGRPANVLVDVLKRPLTVVEQGAERLKDVSAWCSNTFLRAFECGDRVLAVARSAADGRPSLSAGS